MALHETRQGRGTISRLSNLSDKFVEQLLREEVMKLVYNQLEVV